AEHIPVERDQRRRPMVIEQAARLPEPELQVPMTTIVILDVREHRPDVVWDFQAAFPQLFINHRTVDAHRLSQGGEAALGKPLPPWRGQQAVMNGRDGPLVGHEERNY